LFGEKSLRCRVSGTTIVEGYTECTLASSDMIGLSRDKKADRERVYWFIAPYPLREIR
jgi:hypothetical protein